MRYNLSKLLIGCTVTLAGAIGYKVVTEPAQLPEEKRAVRKVVAKDFVGPYSVDEAGQVSYGTATLALEEAYPNVLFSTEFLPMTGEQSPSRYRINLSILRNQKLSQALNAYCEKVDENMAWRRVTEDMVALYPVISRNDAPIAPLDARITLGIEDLTLREALTKLEVEISKSHHHGIDVQTECEGFSFHHPPAVYDEGAISISARQQVGRQILWDIMEQSPVPTSYSVIRRYDQPDILFISMRSPNSLERICGERLYINE